MKILKIAIGNSEEAYIENSFTEGLNIIFSDDNNKGKTIVIHSILYAIGNKPIFPSSFNYRDFYYYLEFEHAQERYVILRKDNSFIVKADDGLRMFEGVAELKHYWSAKIFKLPEIPFKTGISIVDMELFVQLFYVAQDGKDTATIFNQGYYHKDDFKNMVLSFAGDYSSDMSSEEIKKIKDNIVKLKRSRQEKVDLCEFYKSESSAAGYLSRIKDKDEFDKRVSLMDETAKQISEVRKKRSRIASQRSLWNGTLKELRSLNRDIEVGELRCMDCDSANIAYKGKGKAGFSFDVSTPEMRKQITESIQERIKAFTEEISRCDYDIERLQVELNDLMSDENVTIENIVAFKSGYKDAAEIENSISEIDIEIQRLTGKLETGATVTDEAKKKRQELFDKILQKMNEVAKIIDPERTFEYQDLFTKRGSVVSGSEETIFYIARTIALACLTNHPCPIVMDSFRAEDLSSEKEKKAIEQLSLLDRQCILTTTLKAEEKGKYSDEKEINGIDYTNHKSGKILGTDDLTEFTGLLMDFGIKV